MAGSSDHNPVPLDSISGRLPGEVDPDTRVGRDQPHHTHSSRDHIYAHMDVPILGDLYGDGGLVILDGVLGPLDGSGRVEVNVVGDA